MFDEFLSTLDRETAKSMAYLIQKLVRQKNIKVILTTAHADLKHYLGADLLIEGYAFPERFVIDHHSRKYGPQSIKYDIVKTTKETYKESRLGEIHYKGKYTGGAKEYFVARNTSVGDIGFLVTAAVGSDDENKRRIARVVVHPSYRGIGVGTALVKHYLTWARNNGIKKIYATSALGMFNPFFEKAGMDKCENYIVKPSDDFVKQLGYVNFNADKWFSKDYCVLACANGALRNIISKKASGAIRVINPGGKKMTIDEARDMILNEPSHAGRYLWTLRPRILAKYKKDL